MKRLLVEAATIAALIGVPAAPVHAQTAGEDSVIGNILIGPAAVAEFEARSGPQGENPSGFVSLSSRSSAEAGRVACLTVIGNRATIGFENALGGGSGGLIFVEDNGPARDGLDRFGVRLIAQPPRTCPEPEAFHTFIAGDIRVHDAQPRLPISKDQCKNGGWRNFGDTFKNQGQCVAFVERGPKPSED
jgi:hypothetical protein